MSSLNNMMEQVKKLKNGAGVQSLLDSAQKILGNPIAMFNMEYNLQAYTKAETDDVIWNELITYAAFCKDTQLFFSQEGFIEEAANSSRSVLLRSDKLKYDRMTGKIFNKNNYFVSHLMIVACFKPFEEDDKKVFEVICKLISREISKIEYYEEYEHEHQERVIRNLIDGNYDLKQSILQVAVIYETLEPNLYIVAADISQRRNEQANAVYFKELLRKINSDYKYAVYSNCIIIVVSTNNDSINVNKDLREFIKVFEENNIYAGISGRFENLFELQKHYLEALNAMRFTLETQSSQKIFPCCESSIEKTEQIKKLTNGKGIQYFLDIGPEIFGNPLLFHDMELNLLAYTDNMEIIDPIWIELITYGTSSDETINLFKTEGYVATMENTKGGSFLISPKIKYDRISWRIYSNDNIMIGCLSIVNTHKPFTDDELVLFGMFSQKFSKEVGEIEFYNNYGQVYSETVINRLISGKIDDYTFYSEDIGNLYDKFMKNLYLVVIDMAQCKSKEVNLTYFRNLFNWRDSLNRYAICSNYIIIIISTNNDFPDANNELKEIGKLFERDNIYAAMSSRFDNIYDLQKHYSEAVDELKKGIKNKKPDAKQRIFTKETYD